MASIFTRIIQGELPGRFVWRDEQVVAFLTISPIAHGHTLVVPVEEVDHWIDLDPDLAVHCMRVAHAVGRAQQEAFSPTRIGMMIAGLEVPHTHLHLVPIDNEADLSFSRADPSPAADALDDAADRIRRALSAAGHGDRVPEA
jgi:histidine triad (HIT) family protein